MDTIYINTDKISKIVIKDIRPVIWGGRVKYYPEKKGWLNGCQEGYYTEGEQYSWYGKFEKEDCHKDIEGYLYHKPRITVYGNSSEDILFTEWFSTYKQAEDYLRHYFHKFISNEKVIRL